MFNVWPLVVLDDPGKSGLIFLLKLPEESVFCLMITFDEGEVSILFCFLTGMVLPPLSWINSFFGELNDSKKYIYNYIWKSIPTVNFKS